MSVHVVSYQFPSTRVPAKFRACESMLAGFVANLKEENNTVVLEKIVCREELDGLIKNYGRRAA